MTIDKIFENFKAENPEFPTYILKETKEYLPNNIKPKEVENLLNIIHEEYKSALVNTNEAIGIITAQSVGEPSTQMTLNTFHFAGVASQGVEGLPRLIEILDGKKNLKAPIMKLYLKKEGMNDKKFKVVADKIAETKLNEFTTNVNIDMEEKKVVIDLDLPKLKKLKVDIESLKSYLDKRIRKNAQIIDEKQIVIKDTPNSTLKDLMTKKEITLNSIVFGIKGIQDVTLLKENDDYIIVTSGVSLKQVQNIPLIDSQRIYSNDIHAILNEYGIEAAREVIIKEMMEVVKSQGLTINERHVLLIADVMTYTGEIKGMTRYGIVGNKQNVLTRASFETTLKHIAYGALQNEQNQLNTITENVMTNQIVRVGTGNPKISVKNQK